jgi:hypothetical protein
VPLIKRRTSSKEELAWEFGYQSGRRNEPEALTRGNRRSADPREDQEQRQDGQQIEAEF